METTNGTKPYLIILDPMENPSLLSEEQRKKMLEIYESAKPKFNPKLKNIKLYTGIDGK